MTRKNQSRSNSHSDRRSQPSCGCPNHHSQDGMQCAGLDAARQNIVNSIDRGHWGLVGVFGDEEGPYFTYSVGLYENYNHPELVIIGPDPRPSGMIINLVGELIRGGERLETGKVYRFEQLSNSPCIFVKVPKSKYDDYFGQAQWYYQNDDFPVYQMILSDKDGRFPWQKGADKAMARSQKILGEVPLDVVGVH